MYRVVSGSFRFLWVLGLFLQDALSPFFSFFFSYSFCLVYRQWAMHKRYIFHIPHDQLVNEWLVWERVVGCSYSLIMGQLK